jgi:anti-sigma regulatory factor (Ser/Thr protein kinase)
MEHSGFQHSALIYDGEAEYLAATVPFLQGALEAEEPALVAVRPHQAALLEDALGEDGKHVRFVNMHELGRNPAWIIPFWRDFVEECGGRSVRGIGEPVWSARSPAALEECQRHESLLNVAFDGSPAWWLFCPYDLEALDPAVIAEARRSHPYVRNGESRRSPEYRGLDACAAPFAAVLPEPPADAVAFQFDERTLVGVRERISRQLSEMGFRDRQTADFVLAVHELAANSVRHGGGSGLLRLWGDEATAVADVTDAGVLHDPLAGRVYPADGATGGFGLWLANQLCDLVQIRSAEPGTTVRAHLAKR